MSQYIGKSLGPYQILEQIGQGGMATVFKAYQPAMDRYVAIKVLPAHFTEDESFIARFSQEAHTLARLEHPHILPVHDYGEHEGTTYLVMRYIEAGTLKDLIAQRGRLPYNEVTRILGQVGRALGYAHSQGVIHRDVKPSNVLIDEHGNAFLTDFGIAKLVAGTARYTATGAVIGTPAYMAPEQGLGKPADARSDIYSLGVMLYEMITGQVPYEAETPLAVLLKHANDPLPPPRQLKPDLPDAIERVILKALAKSPEDRFQTAEAMVDALQKAVAGLSTEIMAPRDDEETVVAAAPATPAGPKPATLKPAAPPAPSRPAAAPPPNKPIPWLPIAGVIALLAVVAIVVLLVLPGLGGGQPAATPTTQTAALATPKITPGLLPTPTAPPSLPPATQASAARQPGWTHYSNGNFVRALARQGDYLWAGGTGGLVRWDTRDGSHVKFGISDTLPSGIVNDLAVDEEKGFVWIASEAGLVRYDGQEWITFDQTDGLDSDNILSLFLTGGGTLLASTDDCQGGLNYYDGSRWGPPAAPPLPVECPSPRDFVGTEEAGLFASLGHQGLAHYDGEAWTILTSKDGLPDDTIYDLLLVGSEALLVSSGGQVVRLDLATGQLEGIPQLDDFYVLDMHQARDGRLWFAGASGAMRYDPASGDWQPFRPGPGGLPVEPVTAILQDDNGLWFGTFGGGVSFYDGKSWRTWTTGDELGGNSTWSILQDQAGGLWLVHGDGDGLSRYDPGSESWQTFGESEGALDWPSQPSLDKDGGVWIGGYGELKRYDPRSESWQTSRPAELADIQVHAIAIGPDDVQWLWTDAGVMRHDPASGAWSAWTAADHPLLENMGAIYAASDGSLWVGSYDGLLHYADGQWSVPAAVGDSLVNIERIAQAPDGSLWVTADGDLYHVADDGLSHFTGPDDCWLGDAMAIGPDGRVWVAHYGLFRFDPVSSSWDIIADASGLVNPEARSLYVAPEGTVWIGTLGGLSRYEPGP